MAGQFNQILTQTGETRLGNIFSVVGQFANRIAIFPDRHGWAMFKLSHDRLFSFQCYRRAKL
jgi:hypothetical protein